MGFYSVQNNNSNYGTQNIYGASQPKHSSANVDRVSQLPSYSKTKVIGLTILAAAASAVALGATIMAGAGFVAVALTAVGALAVITSVFLLTLNKKNETEKNEPSEIKYSEAHRARVDKEYLELNQSLREFDGPLTQLMTKERALKRNIDKLDGKEDSISQNEQYDLQTELKQVQKFITKIEDQYSTVKIKLAAVINERNEILRMQKEIEEKKQI